MTYYETIDEIVMDLEKRPVESSGHIYHPIPFPEFAHLKTSSDSTEVYRKWNLIKKTLQTIFPGGLSGRKILDVGANAGFFTYSLAMDEAEVTAFEPHPRYAPIGKCLTREKQLPIEWHETPLQCDVIQDRAFDAALMLSVFQWMADGGKRFVDAVEELHAVAKITRYLFFELGFNSGCSCIVTEKRNHYGELIRLLRNGTPYECFMLIGKTKLWRASSRYLVLCSDDQRFDDLSFRKLLRIINI